MGRPSAKVDPALHLAPSAGCAAGEREDRRVEAQGGARQGRDREAGPERGGHERAVVDRRDLGRGQGGPGGGRGPRRRHGAQGDGDLHAAPVRLPERGSGLAGAATDPEDLDLDLGGAEVRRGQVVGRGGDGIAVVATGVRDLLSGGSDDGREQVAPVGLGAHGEPVVDVQVVAGTVGSGHRCGGRVELEGLGLVAGGHRSNLRRDWVA